MQILNQIASIELGFQLRSQVIQSPESKELLIQMKDVSKTNGVNWKTCVPTQLPGKKMPQWLCDGDVIVVARGFNFFAAHIQDIPQGFQAVAAPAFFVLSKINAQILPEYLTWWLNQVPTQRYFEKSAEGAISKSLKRNALENTPVIIPPLEQQKHIVSLARLFREEYRLLEQMRTNTAQMQTALVNQLIQFNPNN
jgi:hypothetical protein